MDLVSVAVAIYNAEKYVATMINSIINQTYTNLEILLVNDGSTDGSLSVCESFDDNRIRIIDKKNGGLSTARQCAIDNAQGKYLCFVDADDYLSKDYIEVLYNAIEKGNADFAVCSYRQYDVNGYERIVNVKYKSEVETITSEVLQNKYYDVGVNYILSDSWNKMYRLSFIKQSGISFSMPREYNGTDWMFNHLLALHNPIVACVDKPLYNYQILQTSRVRRKDKDLQAGFMIIVEQLLAENKKLLHGALVDQQICKMYFDMIRSAITDRYVNAQGYSDFVSKYKDFRKRFYEFNNNNSIKVEQSLLTRGMRVFLMLMKTPIPFPMYVYLRQRRSYVKAVVGR